MVKLSTDNTVAVLELSNPPGNALLQPDFMEKDVLANFLSTHQSKALIITGSCRHFSIGADIELLLKMAAEDNLQRHIYAGNALLQYIYDLDIPVFAAIEGFCFGGGLEIALAAHVRVVSERALLAFPESLHKLMPGLSGTYALKKFLTLGQSLDIILSGRTINAEEALSKGLADFVAPRGSCRDFALKMAHSLTDDKPIKVLNSVMRALKNAAFMPKSDALEIETALFCELARDLKKGINPPAK